MMDYLRRCADALRRGLFDGTQPQQTRYEGSTTEVALFNAASDAVRIALYGRRA